MERRRFLQWLGGTAAGAAASHVLDVDRLLWVPGERTIFVPSPVVAEASFNHLITPHWVVRDMLAILKQNLTFATHINRTYKDELRADLRFHSGEAWRGR